ncbi:unnamed protein product [Effrenium voratum]|nr:unnamed protein product [Effrenium voratum]
MFSPFVLSSHVIMAAVRRAEPQRYERKRRPSEALKLKAEFCVANLLRELTKGPKERAMVIFGGLGSGLEGEAKALGDTWLFAPSKGAGQAAGWRRPTVAGGAPARRFGHGCCMVEDRMLLCGGMDASGPLNDCWLLDLEQMRWEQLETAGGLAPKELGWCTAISAEASAWIWSCKGAFCYRPSVSRGKEKARESSKESPKPDAWTEKQDWRPPRLARKEEELPSVLPPVRRRCPANHWKDGPTEDGNFHQSWPQKMSPRLPEKRPVNSASQSRRRPSRQAVEAMSRELAPVQAPAKLERSLSRKRSCSELLLGGCDRPLELDPSCRTLYFSPVGASFREVTKKNLLHLHASGVVDIFLAHYRKDLAKWQQEPWYNQTVKYSVSYHDIKAGFVLNELIKQRTFSLTGYCWFWIADDNIDFSQLDVKRYLSLAAESGANIVQPAVDFDSHGIPSHEIVIANTDPLELESPDSGPPRRSVYRYSDFVEVMSPLFRAPALPVAWKLYLPGLGSDFGMDQLWCRFVAAKLHGPLERGCAIIDATPMYKLPHFQSYDWEAAMAVRDVVTKEHPEFLQRSIDTQTAELKDGIVQLCRTTDHELVRIRVRPRLNKAPSSWKLVKAYFRCKVGFHLWAECHIDVGVVLESIVYWTLALGIVLCFPPLLWQLLKYIRSLARSSEPRDATFKRRVPVRYRERPWSEAS